MTSRQPALTVDAVVFTPSGDLLLIRRRNEPFAGSHALPGGFVDEGETVENAVRRELREETGLVARTLKLIGVYSDPGRDPRRHTVSIAYLVTVEDAVPAAGDDAAEVAYVQDWQRAPMAFDHARIVADAVRLLRG